MTRMVVAAIFFASCSQQTVVQDIANCESDAMKTFGTGSSQREYCVQTCMAAADRT
jgi:hypothetical protein